MGIEAYIVYITIVVWIFPPIRNYGRKFFYYFLILAFADPLGLLLGKLFGIQIFHTFSILSYLLLITIVNYKTLKNYLFIFIVFVLIDLLLNFYSYTSQTIIICHIIIFSLFVKKLVENSARWKILNFFNVFLAFYEATILIKFFVFSFKVKTGVPYFYFTSAFELLFGIYFSLATEEKPLLTYNLIKEE